MTARYRDWKAQLDVASRVMAVATGFTIPLSTALTGISLAAVLILWLAAGDFKSKLNAIRSNRVAVVSLGLFFIYVGGLSYSTAPFWESMKWLSKYAELLFVAILITVFTDAYWRKLGLYSFAAAMLLTMGLSYFNAVGLVTIGKLLPSYGPFKSRITHGVLMSFSAYLFAQWAIENERKRILFGVISILMFLNVVFVVYSHTGFVVLSSLLMLFMYQRMRWRGIVCAAVLMVFTGSMAYYVSDEMRNRIAEVRTSVSDFSEGRLTGATYRMSFYQKSLILMVEHPVFGTGTGSVENEYKRISGETGAIVTGNPHNEYLNIGLQLGLVGLGLFIYLFYVEWRGAQALEQTLSSLAQGLIVAFGVGCMFNSLLMDFTEGNFFVYFSGLLYGGGGLMKDGKMNV